MTIKFKNNWKIVNKSGKKMALKLRIGKLTLLDIYFTIGQPKVVFTLINYTVTFDKSPAVEE